MASLFGCDKNDTMVKIKVRYTGCEAKVSNLREWSFTSLASK